MVAADPRRIAADVPGSARAFARPAPLLALLALATAFAAGCRTPESPVPPDDPPLPAASAASAATPAPPAPAATPATPVDSADPTGLRAAVDAWHAERLARLTAEDGWLTLVGLDFLEPGPNRVGSDPGAVVSYPGLPAPHVGTLHVEPSGIRFEPAPGVRVDGVPADGRLRTDADGEPTLLVAGRCRFHVIERGGAPAVRLRDPESPVRTGFAGVERFPVDPAWRIEASFAAAGDGTTVPVDSVIGVVDETEVAGRARFRRGDVDVDLVLHPGGAPDRFFVVFGDATNGRDTYPSGRFLLAERTAPDTVTLDFNRAYNPPCAFTDFATCPLPLPDNRLPFAVPAGERAPARR